VLLSAVLHGSLLIIVHYTRDCNKAIIIIIIIISLHQREFSHYGYVTMSMQNVLVYVSCKL